MTPPFGPNTDRILVPINHLQLSHQCHTCISIGNWNKDLLVPTRSELLEVRANKLLAPRRCLRQHFSIKIYPSVSPSIGFTLPHHQSNFARQSDYFHAEASKSKKSTYKRGVALSSLSNELQDTFRVSTWEFVTTYSQRRCGEVGKIIYCLFTLGALSLFHLIVVAYLPLAHILQAMGDKRWGQHFPEEDTSSSSCTSGIVKGQSRYKPLAPKGPLGGESQSLKLATFIP